MSIEVNFAEVIRVIDDMRKAVGAVTDAELAAKLDVNPSAISQWKKRGSVPEKALRRVETIREQRARYYKLDEFNKTLDPNVRHKAIMLAIHFSANRDTWYNGQLDFNEYMSTLGLYASQLDAVLAASAFMILEAMREVGTPEAAFEHLINGPGLRAEIMSRALALHYQNEGNHIGSDAAG